MCDWKQVQGENDDLKSQRFQTQITAYEKSSPPFSESPVPFAQVPDSFPNGWNGSGLGPPKVRGSGDFISRCSRLGGGWAQLASAPNPRSEANPGAAPAAPGAYDQKAAFGPHHWIRTTRQHVKDQNGKIRETDAQYVEVQSGLLYHEHGGWWKSKEEIELREHHAVAYRAPHKVTFQPNINRFAVVQMVTPDGKELRSHVLGLSYYTEAHT